MLDHSSLPIAIRELSYSIGDRRLFQNLNIEVAEGESVAVLGPSGSGKSTLLSCALGLIDPDSGSIEIDGEQMNGIGPAARARLRSRSIGMVFQFGELLPELSPVDNVALASMLARTESAEMYERASQLLNRLGVPESTTVETLSGGERQRVAVARALINEPRLLLVDEPTGALDAGNRDKVADLLFDIPTSLNCSLLVVTHDLAVASRADRMLTIADGTLRSVEPGDAL